MANYGGNFIATFLHTRSFNILRRTGTRVKRKTSENQRFSEEFVGLIDPSVTPARSIDLLRLTTSADTSGCEIYNNRNFKENEHVRVTGGPYQGMEGYVQRVRKNKHVIVKIEGICMVMLPFIHPDLLERIE